MNFLNVFLKRIWNFFLFYYTLYHCGILCKRDTTKTRSANAFGAMYGTLVYGFGTLYLGCKRTILTFALPCLIFYTLIYFGDTYCHILIARFFMGKCVVHSRKHQIVVIITENDCPIAYSKQSIGLGGGEVQTILVLYIAEIASNGWVRIEF